MKIIYTFIAPLFLIASGCSAGKVADAVDENALALRTSLDSIITPLAADTIYAGI